MTTSVHKRGKRVPKSSVGIRRGRFKHGMHQLFAAFNASISFDRRLYAEDIRGSLAHVRMLGLKKIIPARDARLIEKGLKEVLRDIRAGRLEFQEELEDVHINIEEALGRKIGETAGKLHTARSRNDQVALDFRMFLRDRGKLVRASLSRLMSALADKAKATIDVVMPGYTHMQRAQPVRLAHHLMAYFQMFRRDWERFAESSIRADEMPLGATALGGTTFDIDSERVAEDLGFSRIARNSMDAVSDRDFAAEFLFNSALTMMHLSRLAEELILWSSQEFDFCTLPDEFCSGSSIMPQKKNPDACELIRGKTGRVYGNLVALMTMLKALPLTYNKDLQEDKEPVFDSLDTVMRSLEIMAAMIPGIEFNAEKMLDAALDPSLAATDLAEQLARDGVPFREAHAQVGEKIRGGRDVGEGRKQGDELPSPQEMVEARNHPGGTAAARVRDQIKDARTFLRRVERQARRVTSGERGTGEK
jgi:argininosuccinate lyase